jgi:tetratricopeptide (TPR) repeat protein
LIGAQKLNSLPEHMGMSLSRLSHKAKELGVPELQLEWAERATELNPADPLTFAHLADALITVGRFSDAGRVYDKIESLGDRVIAESGRARILRATGKLPEARTRYLSVANDFPHDPNIWHALVGAAKVLRDLGRLDEALTEYKTLTDRFPFEAAVWAGLASVQMDLGRFDEAIKLFGIASSHSNVWKIATSAFGGDESSPVTRRRGPIVQTAFLSLPNHLLIFAAHSALFGRRPSWHCRLRERHESPHPKTTVQ